MDAAAESSAKPGEGWTLLFVDDEANILSALNRLFRPVGYRIFTAPSGAKGLEILEKEKIDLVVSDMRMPEMDGAAFLEQVAQRWPEIIRLLLTGYADINSTISAVNKGGIYRYLQKPWEDNDIRLTVQHALDGKRLERERARLEELTQRQNAELKQLNSTLESKVAARTQDLRRAVDKLQVTHDTLKRNYVATIEIFANLIEMRQTSAAGDARQIARQARGLVLKLGADEAQAQQVMFAGLLHNIGKMGLPDDLLHKPFNSLVANERARLVKHPAMAQTLLMALEPLQEAAALIRAHRERFDGKGYPDGRKGEDIPLGARVLGVVIDFHELQFGRIVPERYTVAQAQQYLRDNRGVRYDARVVDAYLELLSNEQLSSTTQSEVRVRAEELRAGMVLTRDLTTQAGLLLLAKGHSLDAALIAKIQAMETAGEELEFYVRLTR